MQRHPMLELRIHRELDLTMALLLIITEDPICLAYEVSGHSIKEIKHPIKPNRNQWLYNMSYAEWSLDEMRRGLLWKHIRNNINEKN